MTASASAKPTPANAIEVRNLNFFYGKFQGLKNINLDIPERKVTAFIGPSGCGKSTFLRCINRMNDTIENCRVTGLIKLVLALQQRLRDSAFSDGEKAGLSDLRLMHFTEC